MACKANIWRRGGGAAAAAAADEASDVDRQAAQNQKRGRWLASVTSVFTPSGGDGSSGNGSGGDGSGNCDSSCLR